MVCRDSSVQQARQVNPLEVYSLEEKALYDLGERVLTQCMIVVFIPHGSVRNEAKKTISSFEIAGKGSSELIRSCGFAFVLSVARRGLRGPATCKCRSYLDGRCDPREKHVNVPTRKKVSGRSRQPCFPRYSPVAIVSMERSLVDT